MSWHVMVGTWRLIFQNVARPWGLAVWALSSSAANWGNLNCWHYDALCPCGRHATHAMPTKHLPPSFHEFPSFLKFFGCHMLSYHWHFYSGPSSTRNTTQTGSLSVDVVTVIVALATGWAPLWPGWRWLERLPASYVCNGCCQSWLVYWRPRQRWSFLPQSHSMQHDFEHAQVYFRFA